MFKRVTVGFAAVVLAFPLLVGGTGLASASDVQPNIIGGSPATQALTVSLQSVSDTGVVDHECGATSIHPRWVVTAAHCAPYIHDQARLGSVKWNDGGTVVPVAAVYVNPKHNSKTGNFGNDIALVQLARPVYDAPIYPIGIPGRVGAKGLATGWGRTCDRDFNDPACNGANPVELQQLEMKRVSDSVCDLVRPSDGVQLNDHDTMNCVVVADGHKGGVCFGDSGSGYFDTVYGNVKVVTGIINAIMNTTVLQPHACSQTPTGEFNRDGVTDISTQLFWMWTVLRAQDPAAEQDVKNRVVTLAG